MNGCDCWPCTVTINPGNESVEGSKKVIALSCLKSGETVVYPVPERWAVDDGFDIDVDEAGRWTLSTAGAQG